MIVDLRIDVVVEAALDEHLEDVFHAEQVTLDLLEVSVLLLRRFHLEQQAEFLIHCLNNFLTEVLQVGRDGLFDLGHVDRGVLEVDNDQCLEDLCDVWDGVLL